MKDRLKRTGAAPQKDAERMRQSHRWKHARHTVPQKYESWRPLKRLHGEGVMIASGAPPKKNRMGRWIPQARRSRSAGYGDVPASAEAP